MNVDEVRRRAAAYDSLLGAGLAVVYLLTATVIGAVLTGDPTSSTPIVSDLTALGIVAHAYDRDRFLELGTSLVVALVLLAWLLAATPAFVTVDLAAALPAWLPDDAGKPLLLAAVLIAGYALVLRDVVPTVGGDRR